MTDDHHWMVDATTGRLSGQTLDDGRYIWLTPHVMGRLAEDPILHSSFGGTSNNAICNGMAGGYVEDVGGRIYELGTPAPASNSRSTLTASSIPTLAEIHDDNANNNIDKSKSMAWWVPATTATISGLVASCVLSACIGYGAGLSIIQDNHQALETTTSAAIPPLPSLVRAPGPVAASEYATSTTTTSSSSLTTQQEQQERLQRRIYNEQRMIQMIQDKMVSDQTELQNLQN